MVLHINVPRYNEKWLSSTKEWWSLILKLAIRKYLQSNTFSHTKIRRSATKVVGYRHSSVTVFKNLCTVERTFSISRTIHRTLVLHCGIFVSSTCGASLFNTCLMRTNGMIRTYYIPCYKNYTQVPLRIVLLSCW